ncbi:hypothetical protein E3P89_00131 [Wallemia ichthyophaga]|uniref:Cleavage/polyadenylation specificity factor A subunit C-terminal domain-containing protein n=1 Tax=Wallemia ichthyophaga TaxID=245174 RepID=A0A4T0GW49_WALIC|nr:hypothetical protein E3P95_00036 [Wallemia ichthyophaga]TIB05962.1 hypothetical protein E3P94_00036 [Wallemia ichthyophaga]TIB17341.1 hypothetical protein E3P90_00036 [Wallemia ichthyophaga]TIB18502.1 hypothetical protein E3P93_00036 [Wallemia ichthyophaga]TIB26252.1 hypothetical protein E3P89_00131 [Wallemia ichthyophaga]
MILTHFNQLLPTSGVEFACHLKFTSSDTHNIITTANNTLKIYEISIEHHQHLNQHNIPFSLPSAKLLLRREYHLHGEIVGVQSIRILASIEDGKDRLLLSFRDAKIALLEWSNDINDIVTVSIHTYERSSQVLSQDMTRFKSNLQSDPDNRCSALLLPDDSLALLSVHGTQADLDDLDDDVSKAIKDVPYAPSFILPLKSIDQDMCNVIDYCFLPGFHNPTLAILCQPRQTWTGRLSDSQDTCQLFFLTLDIVTQVYPIIATVDNLPYDCISLTAAPKEVGGVAILSANAIIHVDQNGRPVGRATNGWSTITSSRTHDPPPKDLFVRLEGASIGFLKLNPRQNHPQALLFLPNGDIHAVQFYREGRTISRVDISKPFARGSIPSGAYRLDIDGEGLGGGQFMFVPSMVGVSFLLRIGDSLDSLELFPKPDKLANTAYDDMDVDIDEDLYGSSETKNNLKEDGDSASHEPPFTISDYIQSHGPVQDITMGRYTKTPNSPLQILAATGAGHVGGITAFHQEIPFESKKKLDISCNVGLWTFALSSLGMVIVASDTQSKTKLFKLLPSNEIELVAENDEVTVSAGLIANKSRILIVGKSSIKVFQEGKFLVSLCNHSSFEICLQVDGEAIERAIVDDRYVLTFLEDDRKILFNVDGIKLNKVADLKDDLRILSIYKDVRGVFGQVESRCLCTVTKSDSLDILMLPSLESVFSSKHLAYIPSSMFNTAGTEEAMADKDASDGDGVLEACLVNLGRRFKRTNLIVLHESGHLVLYDTFNSPTGLAFSKVTSTVIQISATVHSKIIPCNESGAVVTGRSPVMISCEDTSPPRIHRFSQKYMQQAAPFTDGIIYLANDVVTLARIGDDVEYSESLPLRRLASGRHFDKIAFDPTSQMYAATSTASVPFRLFDNAGNYLWKPPMENLSPATSYRSSIELLSHDCRSSLFGYEFEQNEFVICCDTVSLLSPSANGTYKDFIGVGTCINKGEDVAVKGAIYLFEIVELVPSSKDVGNNYKLRLLMREETRGAVSAITSCSGYFVVAVGQKVLIRALEINERLVSVAFYDAGTYIVSLEVLKNFILVGDQVKSITFLAFQESPYKLVQLSRDARQIETCVSNFLAYEDQITFVSNDIKGDMRLIDYNPFDPAAEGGEKLIRTTEFHKGAEATCSLLLAKPSVRPSSELLLGGVDGSLSCLTPVDEQSFKALWLLQGALVRQIPHVAALNPRAHRHVRNDYVSRSLSKGILDGLLLSKYQGLDHLTQIEIAKRIGYSKAELLAILRNHV